MSDRETGSGPVEPPAEAVAPEPNEGERRDDPVPERPGSEAVAERPRLETAPEPPPRSEAASPAGRRPARPNLIAERTAVSREHKGYAFRLEPPELARLRELPGSRGKTDEELGAEFLESQGERLAAALAGDLPAPATVQVLVDPYSRQAFLAFEDRVRGIVSF